VDPKGTREGSEEEEAGAGTNYGGIIMDKFQWGLNFIILGLIGTIPAKIFMPEIKLFPMFIGCAIGFVLMLTSTTDTAIEIARLQKEVRDEKRDG
jgi:hypothetical protein